MTHHTPRGPVAALSGYDDAQALLARYPALDGNELAALKYWFGKQASAFEVASLASNPDIASKYAGFKADHIDRFELRDWIKIVAVVAVVLALIGAGIILT